MASKMVPTEPKSKLNTFLMVGAAAVAGAAIGKHLSDAQYEKAMKEEIPQSRGVGGPGIVEGSSIQEWNRYVAEYRARYGNKIVTMAMDCVSEIQSAIDLVTKGLEEDQIPKVSRIPIIVPYQRSLIEQELYRNGTNIYLTGRNLVPCGMIRETDFNPNGPLGTAYHLNSALRASRVIAGHERAFDPENRANTLLYIKMMNRIAYNKADELVKKFYKVGLQYSTYMGDGDSTMTKISDPLYRPFIISFDMDVRRL